jgi:antitoxin CcdA
LLRIIYAHLPRAALITMRPPSDPRSSKKPVNLSINSDLLGAARQLNINLSATLEAALRDEIRRQKRELWLAENQAAIAAYNERVESDGVFSDGLRGF